MIGGLKPYPTMKDSGVPWLGEVPEHWDTRRLRNLSRTPIRNGVGESAQAFRDEWPRYIRITDIAGPRRLKDSGKASLPPEFMQSAPVGPGDILLAAVGATYGKAYLHKNSTQPACFAGYLVRWSPSDAVLPEWASYWTESSAYWDQVHSCVIKSTIENFSASRFRGLSLALPPLPEQAAIVRFLDHADRRIRRYIRAKQGLIKLLEEQKQAIIHRAVTRGLDPNVRLKPSGVEWLGDVPKHWEVRRLHQITDPGRPIMYGIVLPGPNVDEGVYIVKGGNCEPGRLRPEMLSRTTFEIEVRYSRSRLAARDIVFAIRGGVGAAEMVPPELTGANLTQDAARIAADVGIDPRWLLYAVRAPIFREHVKSQVVGATVRGINIRNLKRIEVVVPPTEEQGRIVQYLDGATSRIVSASDRARREIDLLGEYRSSLIADVVTGKLDVREAAARLPQEAENFEPPEEAEVEDDTEEGDADGVPGELES